MKVAIICDVLGEENNGTTIAALNLIKSLRARGHEVRVVCCDESRRGQDGFYITGEIKIPIITQAVHRNGVTLAKADKKIIRQALEGVDIIHVMIPFALGRAATKIALEMNIPISAGFHSQAENFTSHIWMMNSKIVNKLTYHSYYRGLYRYCDCVHYPTQFICDLFEKEVGATNHYVISNGVGSSFTKRYVEKPDALKDDYVILFIGRYSKEKTHKILLDAVAKSNYKDKIQLILAGAGPQRTKIAKHAKKIGIKMPIMNFYSREELINVINYSDLYVHPAKIEIEAISCLEAIACGKVPVISNSPLSATNRFALHETNLFDYRSADSLAKRIDYWIEHPLEKQECSEEYAGYSSEFDYETCMDKMEDMLLKTINNYKKGTIH